MPGPKQFDISTESGFAFFAKAAAERRIAGERVIVKFVEEKRSIDQNAMIYKLYREISSQTDDQSANDIRQECKLLRGVPILVDEDETFRDFWSPLMSLTYEQQLKAMDYIDVTSLMNRKQCTAYIETIIRDYTAQGFGLAREDY